MHESYYSRLPEASQGDDWEPYSKEVAHIAYVF